MSNDKEVPVWHAIVGDDYEPVQIGDNTKPDEDILIAGGWVPSDRDGFLYTEYMRPRRRRKVSFTVWTYRGGHKPASPGDCFRVSEDGELIPIEPIAEGDA